MKIQLVEVNLSRGGEVGENDGGEKSNQDTYMETYGNVTIKSPVRLIYANKKVRKKKRKEKLQQTY